MKKTSTRLATIGGTILLGACAIALAQHDSRKKERQHSLGETEAGGPSETLAAPMGFPGTSDASIVPRPLVRANNEPVGTQHPSDSSPGYDAAYAGYSDTEESNPLRGSEVVMAGAEQSPSQGFPGGAGFPGGSGYSDGGGLPTLPTGTGESLTDLPPGGLPTLPSSQPAQIPPAQPGVTGQDNGTPSAYAPPPIGSGLPSLPPPGAGFSGGTTMPTAPPPRLGGATSSEASPLPAGPGEMATNPSVDQQGNAPGASQLPRSNSLSDTQRPALPVSDYSQPKPTSPQQSPAPAGRLSDSTPSGYPQNGPAGFESRPTPLGQSNLPQSPGGSSRGTAGGSGMLAANATRVASNVSPGTLASLVSNQPGNRYLDGPQRPDVAIEIRPPADEIQVGKKATFMLMVSNRGQTDALNVRVVDSVPKGARFVGSEPQVSPTASGLMVFELGTVPAGEERLIRINLVPEVEGEIGSTASVLFAAQASVRTLATQPKLELEIDASPDVLIGSNFQPRMTIRNRGSGVARNVVLEVDVAKNLSHPGGSTIAAEIHDLHPSESRPIDGLVFAAAVAGNGQCVIRALTDDGVQLEEFVNIEVKAPKLVAQIQGPRERYLQREAIYKLAVLNDGTAAATNLDFAVHLPAGLKYVGCDLSQAEYDRARHILHVGLTELPAGTPAEFQIQLMPVELGPQSFSLKANGDLGITAEAMTQVDVNGRAELEFLVRQDNGAIEVGATTTYEVQVLNKGDKPDKNVQLQITLPEGSRLVNVNPQIKYRQQGNVVQFEPIVEMPIRDARTYRFEVEHNRSGTQVLQSRIVSENLNVGVLKEVPTFVYDDGE